MIDPTSPKWPISAISLINTLNIERRRRSAACDRHRRRYRDVFVGTSLSYKARRPSLSLNAATSDNSSLCESARRERNTATAAAVLRARVQAGEATESDN